MKNRMLSSAVAILLLFLTGVCFAGTTPPTLEEQQLNDLLNRAADQTTSFLDQFSDVKCTEVVRQMKLGKDDKVELKEESTYDYLVILTNAGGELNLSESRIPVREAKRGAFFFYYAGHALAECGGASGSRIVVRDGKLALTGLE